MLKYFVKGSPKPSKYDYEFKMTYSFDKRKEESSKLLIKYNNKYPIILEKADTSLLPISNKKKYLLPSNLTIGQFILIIRKQIKLESSNAIFLFVDNNIIPQTIETIEKLYSKYADKDGFLYITYCSENTFG